MNREQENGPDMAEQSMGQGNPEDPKAKFEGMVDKAKAGAKSENPYKRTAESRDARIGQLRVYIDVAEKQIAGFQELRDHLNEPDYTLKSEASRGAQVKQYGGANEASVNRQIELQNNQIEALNREIKDLSE
jgi:hypothetical protein